MAYENLKTAIKQVIKQNGNQEITGSTMQSTLLSMVDNIPEVVQTTGETEDKVMSQKAVSDKLNDLSKKAATKFYLSDGNGGTCTAEFDDETGTVVFKPIVTMRRFNGDRDEDVDIHEKLVAAGCTYNEETGLCSITFGGNADNQNISIYYLNGSYGVATKDVYNIPQDAELVLHIAKNPNTFYFYGGAAAIWTARYNYLKLKKAETDLLKKAATKFYLSDGNGGTCTAKFDDETGTVVFKPIVTMRRFNGDRDEDVDIHEKLVAAGCTYDEETGLCTVSFGKNADNLNLTIYYLNGVYGVTRFSTYEVPSKAEIVLHIARNPDSFYFMGGAAAIWTECYNNSKLKKVETKVAKKVATKFYLSNEDGKNDIMFSDNSITFKPKVSMRRLNGEKDKEDGTETDITELFRNLTDVAIDSSTGNVTVHFNSVDSSNMTIYYDGKYHVCRINVYEVPANAELVLHCGRNKQGFYFMGGAASMWELVYNEWKLKKVETKAAKNIGNQIITQFSYEHPGTWSLGQKKITLLHFSDIHGDEKNFKRIVQYIKEKKSMLTDVICTGDIVNYQFSDGIDWWKNNIGDNRILMAIGNHDPLVTQGTFDWFGKNAAECYERYFSPYISNWGVNYTQDLCYYYKDYSDVSIRLIVLDGMRWNNIKEDAVQEDWFKQQLNDAKEKNLHVIVASHFPPDTSVGNKNNDVNFDCWYSVQAWETEQYGLLSPKVADSVDSFQNNGGNFICYIGGHTHGDLFRPLKRYPNQLMVIVANASCYEHVNNADCWYSRSESDNSQDLFNLLNIDTENKILSIVRVGCCFDRYARHIGTISFDYENHKVLSQY